MNTALKIAATCGIALVAATAVATPSLATTTEPSAAAAPDATPSAQGDRIQGPFRTWSSPNNDTEWNRWELQSDNRLRTETFNNTTPPSGGTTWTFPAPGTSGPISPASDPSRCLTWSTFYITPQACTGGESTLSGQQWTLLADGQIVNLETGTAGISDGDTRTPSAYYLVAESETRRFDRVMLNAMTPVVPVTPPEQAEPVLITGPAAGSIIEARAEFTGTGEPGARIVLRDSDDTLIGETTVRDDETWTIVPTTDLTPGPLTVIAEQTVGTDDPTTDTRDFVVADGEDSPVIEPTLAGITGLGALALAATTITLRRRRA